MVCGYHKLGLASDLKKTNKYVIKKSIIEEDVKQLIMNIKDLAEERYQGLKGEISEKSSQLYTQLGEVKDKLAEYEALAREKSGINKETLTALKAAIKDLKLDLQVKLREWDSFCKQYIRKYYQIDPNVSY